MFDFLSNKKDMVAPREYQLEAVSKIVNTIINSDQIPVMSSGCGSGKTKVSGMVLEVLLDSGIIKRALFIAEGKAILRKQGFCELVTLDKDNDKKGYLVSFKGNYKVYRVGLLEAGDKLEDYNDCQILVSLASTIKRKDLSSFDFLVQDEAHNRYLEKEAQTLIEKADIKKQLLLTATPAPFVLENLKSQGVNESEKYNIIVYSLAKLINLSHQHNQKWFAEEVKFYTSSIQLTGNNLKAINKNFNQEGDIKGKVDFTNFERTKLTKEALKLLLKTQITDTLDKLKWLESLLDNVDWLKKLVEEPLFKLFTHSLGKTMIACHNQEFAIYLGDVLTELGIKTVVSCEESDKDSSLIKEFQADNSIKILVVVQRALIGFNYPQLENIIDLSGTRNISRLFQLLNRLIRYSKKIKVKRFYKVGFEGEEEVTKAIMLAAMSLTCTENVLKFNGKNGLDLPIVDTPKGHVISSTHSGSNKSLKKKYPKTDFDGLNIIDVFTEVETQYQNGYTKNCKTTLRDVLEAYNIVEISAEKRLSIMKQYITECTEEYVKNGNRVPNKYMLQSHSPSDTSATAKDFSVYYNFKNHYLRTGATWFRSEWCNELDKLSKAVTGRSFAHRIRKIGTDSYERIYAWMELNNGRTPRKKGAGEDDYEEELGDIYAACKKSPSKHWEFINKVDEIQKKYGAIPLSIEDKHEELLKWVDAHEGGIPSAVSGDSNERKLNTFLNTCKDKRYRHKHTEFLENFEKLLNKYGKSIKKIRDTQEMYKLTLEFVQEHNGKLPQRNLNDLYEKELYDYYRHAKSKAYRHNHQEFLNSVEELISEHSR